MNNPTQMEMTAPASGEGVEDIERGPDVLQMKQNEVLKEGSHAMPPPLKAPLMLIGFVLVVASLAVSILFLVIWLLLMPIKCCSSSGALVSMLECIMNQGVKIPIRIAKCFF
eukprot:g17886.t1